MAARVSPRSNASSASSSSSTSRRAYRNPSFGRDRDGVYSDRWGADSRNSGSGLIGKQQQLHQQQNKGQWGQKSHQAGRAWGNSDFPIADRNDESRLPWRSQKQAVDSFSDGGRLKGIQEPRKTYEPIRNMPFMPQGQPAVHTVRGQWNQATIRAQGHYTENSSRFNPTNHAQQPSWERHQPSFTKQDPYNPSKITTGNYYPPASTANYGQGIRGAAANSSEVIRDAPANLSQGVRGVAANSSQGIRDVPGNFSHGIRGEAGVKNAYVANKGANRGWESSGAPIIRRHDESNDGFPPLTTRGEAGAKSAQTVDTYHKSANRFWGSSGASINSWYDECTDDDYHIMPPQVTVRGEAGAKNAQIVDRSHKADWESLGVSLIKRPDASNDGYGNAAPHLASRDTWRQNSQQASNVTSVDTSAQSVSRDSWRHQEPGVRKGDASRSTSFAERHGSFKHTVPITSEQTAGKSGDRQKGKERTQSHSKLGGHEGREESVVTPKGQALSSQADTEGADDAMLPLVMGSCEDMCPVKEREQRERLRDLAIFERVKGNPGRTSRELAVKKFCRTFSGVTLLSSDVRPLRILWSTLQYLLNLLDDTEFSFDVVHSFLFDRTRAIRQELGMQRISNSQAITMYEEIVRFHILSEHELSQRGSGRHVSDSHLNLQQLSKSILSLFDLYRLNTHENLANEPEFRAYYVLLNLGSNSRYQADSLSLWFRQCPIALLNAWELKFARAVLRCYRSGNFRNFFQLAQKATFLQSCLMELHFNEVRLEGLAAMNHGGYKLHPIPLADIAKQLLIKEGDLEELCNLCGLSTGMDTCGVRCLLAKQSQFSVPKEIPFYRCPCIVNKQPPSYYEEVTDTNQNTKRLS